MAVQPLIWWAEVRWRRAGECPEWQRELTVNQPSYDFEGSSPSSPTNVLKMQIGVHFEWLREVAKAAHNLA